MEQNSIDYDNRSPPLSADLPWLPARSLDGTGNPILGHYKSRIPKLLGRRIRGYSHGWVILSNIDNIMWSLWNPVTSKIITLPPLTSDSELIGQCCLSAPPDDQLSVLLLTINGKSTFVFCQLSFKLDRLRWTKMPYGRQLVRIVRHYGDFLQYPTCYNGKVYALCNRGDSIIQVDIRMKYGEVSMKLSLLGRRPSHICFPKTIALLKGSSTELFCILVYFNGVTRKTLGNVHLFKWDMTSKKWEVQMDIKDAAFFVDLSLDYIVYCNHVVASELGGCVHIRDAMGKMLYSFDVKDKTISNSSMAYPTIHVSPWDKIDARLSKDDEVELSESRLLDLPFHLLEVIMDRCIGAEYLYFRATCLRCHIAAPLIQWGNIVASRRLRKYSLVSPWLMVVDKTHNVINFTDPMSGDKYSMKRSHVLTECDEIRCSTFGWLLLHSNSKIFFFNPFTDDIRELPRNWRDLNSLCFSAPPTSPDCKVVGFTNRENGARVHIHFVAREQTWRTTHLDFNGVIPNRLCFPTICGEDIYVLCDKGEVYVFKNLFKLRGFYLDKVPSARHCGGEYFLVKRDEQLLQVVVGEVGEYVEVFELNRNYRKGWEKIECLGKYMIYISGSVCLCVEAKVSEMENKVYFSRLHSKNGKILFYSLETRRYHVFNGKNAELVGLGREHISPHIWIEPTWS